MWIYSQTVIHKKKDLKREIYIWVWVPEAEAKEEAEVEREDEQQEEIEKTKKDWILGFNKK